MEEQILDTPVATQRRLNYAGFWIRAAAYVIDAIIFYAVSFAVNLIFLGSYSLEANVGVQVALAVMGVIYFIGMESSSRQATLGKMAVGIMVGDQNGNRISVGQAAGRYFGKILSALILFVGFMMAGWDDKKQALHDKLAGTFVFYK
jgi:uncharacterized RDD family membrane protein YckC